MVSKKASGFSSDHQQESLIVQIESLIEVKNKIEAEKEHMQSENKNLKKQVVELNASLISTANKFKD